MIEFRKVRFYTPGIGATAGLVLSSDHFPVMNWTTVSQFFPLSEATKMAYFEQSPSYPTYEQAFLHEFKKVIDKKVN